MNAAGRTSKLLDLARSVPSEIVDGASNTASLLRREWRKLGGVRLQRGRYKGEPRKRRERAPDRTYSERRKQRKGWQD